MTEKFIKKVIEVKAVQFTEKNKNQVYNWARSIQANVYHDWDDKGFPCLKIPTLEGEMICSIEDYIIVEPYPIDWRKLYPCKKEIFEQAYLKLPGEEKHKWEYMNEEQKILSVFSQKPGHLTFCFSDLKGIENYIELDFNASEDLINSLILINKQVKE